MRLATRQEDRIARRNVTLVLTLLVTLVRMASAETIGADVGSIYLSGSATSHVDNIVVEPMTPFEFYIVVEIDYADIGAGDQNATNGISGWQARPHIPSDVIVTQVQLNPPNALDFDGWVIGLGTTFAASTTPVWLAKLTGLILDPVAPDDLMLEIRASDFSSFNPPAPGFLDGEITGECTLPDQTPRKCLRRFVEVKGMSINRTVGAEAPSWSDLKSRFER